MDLSLGRVTIMICNCINMVTIIFFTSLGYMLRVGQKTIYIYGVYTVFLAGKSPNIWSYTVHM